MSLTRDQVQERIQGWLVEENYAVKVQEDPKAYFVIAAQHPAGIGLAVGQEIGKKDRLLIQGGLNFDEDTRSRLRNLPEKDRENLLWDIRFSLINIGVQFVIVNGKLPTAIQISKLLYYDGLSKDRLMELTQKVTDATLLVLWKFQRKFGAPAPKQEQMYG